MSARASRLALGVLAAAACACASAGGGDAGPPASGEATSCGPLMYILNGQCLAFPPFSDADVRLDDGRPGASDAEVPSEAAPSDAAIVSSTMPDASE